VFDNVVQIESWLSIAGVGCDLIGVGAGEEQARTVHASGPPSVERTSRFGSRDWWSTGSSADRMVARTGRQSRGQFLG
jgi:hypothetical protein